MNHELEVGFFFLISSLEDMVVDFWERGREAGRERVRNIDQVPLSGTLTGD